MGRSNAEKIKIGRVIRRFRETKGMTMTDLGRSCGYTTHPYLRVYTWEKDIRPVPIRLVRRLACILGVPVAYLLMTETECDKWIETGEYKPFS